MQDGAIGGQAAAPPRGWAAAVRADTGSALIVAVGSAIAAAAFLVDYFGLGAGAFGYRQFGVLGVGALVIGAGVWREVRAGRRSWTETAKFAAIVAQLALLVAALNVYKIENRAFFSYIATLTLFGFITNAYLPRPARPTFFLALSIAAFGGVFMIANPAAGLWLFGLGLGLFAIAHLPIPLWSRIAILVGATVGLALMRAGVIETDWSGIVLPILASMFMFRLPIYLYDIATRKVEASWSQRLSYFFMMPNAVFPFFPVVDFTTMGRTYYNAPANEIYQRGATWMLRGLIHLLLYRAVNSYLVITPESISNPGEFLQFIVSNFALYLRISGLFHMIVGLLLLFGFNLPETHTRFYFSNSFIDFWRRINIYWKDFMQKMVFNPSYMRLKRLGVPHLTSVCLSMLAVFFATWSLHAYNWFWLRGTVLFTAPDMLFWGALALFLVAQTLYEARTITAEQRARNYPIGPRAFLVIRTTATFLTICLLWSLWTSETVSEWLQVWAASGLAPALDHAGRITVADLLVTAATCAGVVALVALTIGFTFGLAAPPVPVRAQRRAAPSDAAFYRGAALASLAMIVLVALQTEPGRNLLAPQAQEIAEELSDTHLNARDQARLERGYYENLTNVNQFNSELWELLVARPHGNSTITDMAGVQMREDYLTYEFIPGSSSSFNRVQYDINSWGMRDRERGLEKPPGARRVAMVGTSRAVGWGVEFEDGFVARVERMLSEGGAESPVEMLNFSVDGYSPGQRVIALEEKVLRFAPDVVIYEGGYRDLQLSHMATRVRAGVPLPFAFQRTVVAKARVHAAMSQAEIERRLYPYRFELLTGYYGRFVASSRASGAAPLYLYLPAIYRMGAPVDPDELKMLRIAESAGFTLLDLSKVYRGHKKEQLQQAAWDDHPNELGHRLIADMLYQELKAREAAAQTR